MFDLVTLMSSTVILGDISKSDLATVAILNYVVHSI